MYLFVSFKPNLTDTLKTSTWGQHGAHLGPTGPRWAPCWPPWTLLSGYINKLRVRLGVDWRLFSQISDIPFKGKYSILLSPESNFLGLKAMNSSENLIPSHDEYKKAFDQITLWRIVTTEAMLTKHGSFTYIYLSNKAIICLDYGLLPLGNNPLSKTMLILR